MKIAVMMISLTLISALVIGAITYQWAMLRISWRKGGLKKWLLWCTWLVLYLAIWINTMEVGGTFVAESIIIRSSS